MSHGIARILDLALDGGIVVLWTFVALFFLRRYLVHTRKLVSLALSVMAASCASVGFVDYFYSYAAPWVVMRCAFLAAAIFMIAAIVRVERYNR